jgi:broad specificity phosphatase PhoE
MKQLYFIRHGESEFNRANKWVGSTDTPLTETGHQQAKKAGEHLRMQGLSFDIIISSPLERAHQTAKHVASEVGYPHEKIIINERLVERDFGTLEGKRDLIAATKYMIDESAIDRYDEVEKLIDLHNRVVEVLEEIQKMPHDTILIVGHGAFGRALRRHINNEPLSMRGKSFDNAEVARLV